ncbi:MAG: carbohydrate kinase family protein [Desulfovibrio sp.]|uniref:carbohydrate kinase family protein n=1 Tax=Desulfovibrio sp. 7SRBS1 TaxID=3378064 RepID=UPI003B4182B9
MGIFLTGSLCYDRIMSFPGKFQDHILPDKIHTLNVSFMVNGLQEMRGGTAGNIAYNLALLGEAPTVVATAGGKDFDPYAECFDGLGLPLDGICRIDDEFTGGCYIFTDMTNNQITGFNPGALKYASSYDFSGVDAAKSFACVSPGNVDDMTEYPERYKKLGIPYFYDPGQQIPVLSPEQMLSAIDGAYAMVSNDYELEMVMKATGKTMDELLQLTDHLIVTVGEHGSRIITRDGQTEVGAVKAEVIKDPTGAGDAFRAGVIKGLVTGKSLEESCQIGSVAAVYCVEQGEPQGQSYTQDEFWKRYAANFG